MMIFFFVRSFFWHLFVSAVVVHLLVLDCIAQSSHFISFYSYIFIYSFWLFQKVGALQFSRWPYEFCLHQIVEHSLANGFVFSCVYFFSFFSNQICGLFKNILKQYQAQWKMRGRTYEIASQCDRDQAVSYIIMFDRMPFETWTNFFFVK